ncbi:mannosyltransferase family protein [Streptomyces sp. RFCAC02]|uniref:mannosyltransferase family protein n=1 Tax=Streptomyces sp. RFCAC02 TaxID=2499143 RepID=UPI00102275F3|nr:mannosyltransferase family protein [Streptomyces sp. RFCAC02]
MTATPPTGTTPAAVPAQRSPARETGRPRGRRRLPRGRLTATDLRVLRLYLFTRVGMALIAYCATWLDPEADGRTPGTWLSRWEHWDWGHYLHIAQNGYFVTPPGQDPVTDERVAFFPGFPFALRAVHALVGNWTVAGLLISLAGGAVAVVALARIAGLGRGDGAAAGRRAAAFWLLSPTAVFLAAGYTEALFLAFALPAWLAAKNRHWALAGLLGAAATTVRISGLFLAAAILVEFLLAHRGRPWRDRLRALPWCAVPAVPAAAYMAYLYARTDDWMAWKHAQERGWNRDFHTPVEAFRNTWRAAFDHAQSAGFAMEFQLEMAAMVVGVLLLAVLLVRRHWPEAVFVALNLYALGTSYWFLSVPRSALLWWPLWIGLARLSLRWSWVKEAYAAIAAPLMVVLALTFTSGGWAG